MLETLASLRDQLTEDPWRKANGFSEDINEANEILLDPLTSDAEKEGAYQVWVKGGKAQPCVFGKIAGSRAGLDFCFITSSDIGESDDYVAAKIQASRRFWKKRAFTGMPKHGFMVVLCDRIVAFAEPNKALNNFSLHAQKLAGWTSQASDRGNDMVFESVYLQKPKSDHIAKFTFSVDYFAAAADKRWWHDHRTPGGIAFTANSLGHMTRHQEWYGRHEERIAWALRQAISTIGSAYADHPKCPATYLLNLQNGKPAKEINWCQASPFIPSKNYAGKDITSYQGYLHTDHAIRAEFGCSSLIWRFAIAAGMTGVFPGR